MCHSFIHLIKTLRRNKYISKEFMEFSAVDIYNGGIYTLSQLCSQMISRVGEKIWNTFIMFLFCSQYKICTVFAYNVFKMYLQVWMSLAKDVGKNNYTCPPPHLTLDVLHTTFSNHVTKIFF